MFSLATLLLIPVLVSGQQICFNRNGLRTNDIPCNPNDTASACCGRTFKCMSNGLCAPGPDTAAAGFQVITAFYQGSCTDNAWRDAACPNFCKSSLDSPSGQGLQACAAAGDGKYCCWRSGQDCCRNSTAILDLGVANVFTTVGVVASSRSVSMSTSMVSTSIAESTSSNAPTSATIGVTSATNQWLSGTPASSQSDAAASSSGPSKTVIGAGVGVGVGIPLLIGIIAAALLYRRRKRRHAVYATTAHMVEKPELDSWNSNVSQSTDANGKYVRTGQQHEMDAVDRRVFELR
ncbi:hypothetical protein DE146DRAFT_739788 [Phaeosphaeria sp. MPI-PUGE-AT-0046c]|nr:hypothetical protein DE146DRAFT_739788 [Phaeosphaeria sp. MPI-PUGE-AT-0046c]